MISPRKPLVAAVCPVADVAWSGIGAIGALRGFDRGRARVTIAVRVTSPLPSPGAPFLPGLPMPSGAALDDVPPGAPLRADDLVVRDRGLPSPRPGQPVALRWAGGVLEAPLGFAMLAWVDHVGGTVAGADMRCVDAELDPGGGSVTWTFVGAAADRNGEPLERIVVAAVAPHAPRDRAVIDPWLPRSRFVPVAQQDDLAAGRHPAPLPGELVELARWSTWDAGPVAATVPIELVARIQVELLGAPSRSEVLDRHGFDEHAWSLEERAAAERLAAVVPETADAGTLPADVDRFARAWNEARSAQAQGGSSVVDYARLCAALSLRDPSVALAEAGLDPGGFAALELEMAERLDDPAAREAFDQAFETATASLEREGTS